MGVIHLELLQKNKAYNIVSFALEDLKAFILRKAKSKSKTETKKESKKDEKAEKAEKKEKKEEKKQAQNGNIAETKNDDKVKTE